jgi:hypothetical protein
MGTFASLHWRRLAPPLFVVENAESPPQLASALLTRVSERCSRCGEESGAPAVAATAGAVELEAHRDIEAAHAAQVALAEARVREVALEQRAAVAVGLAALAGLSKRTTGVPLRTSQVSSGIQLRLADTYSLGHRRRRLLAVAESAERFEGAIYSVQHWCDRLRAVVHLAWLSVSVLLVSRVRSRK